MLEPKNSFPVYVYTFSKTNIINKMIYFLKVLFGFCIYNYFSLCLLIFISKLFIWYHYNKIP